MSIVSVMPSNHLILCRPLLLLPSVPTLYLGFSYLGRGVASLRRALPQVQLPHVPVVSSHRNYYLFLFCTGVMRYNYRLSYVVYAFIPTVNSIGL